MDDEMIDCSPDSAASSLLLDGDGGFTEVESVALTEDGEFVLWAGLKLPLGPQAGEAAKNNSQIQHALLKLVRGPGWDNRSFSSQVSAGHRECVFTLHEICGIVLSVLGLEIGFTRSDAARDCRSTGGCCSAEFGKRCHDPARPSCVC